MRSFLIPALAALSCTSVLKILARRAARRAEAKYPPRGSFVSVDGLRLHYVRKGEGIPVVLLHGNDGSLLDFSMSVLDLLAGQFDVVAFDRPGHGYSDLPKGESLNVETQAALLRSALSRLGIERPILVAHSWGAMLALHFALAYRGAARGLVLIAGQIYPGPRRFSIYDLLEKPALKDFLMPLLVLYGHRAVRKALRQAFFPDEPPESYVDAFVSLTLRPKQIRALCRDEISAELSLQNMSSRYHTVDAPVIILTGDQDEVLETKHHSFPLHKELPDSELILLAGGGHQLQFSHPQEILKAVTAISARTA